MPRDGSGVYSYPPGTRGSANATIASAKYNAYIDDAAQDANTPRPVVMGGTGGATADEAAANLGLISAKDLAGTGVVGGTATDITIATDRVYTILSNTIYLSFKAAEYSVAGGTTIALDGMDPVALRKIAASGDVDINVGDLVLDGIYQIRYDSTIAGGDGGFILINPSSAGGDSRVGIGVYSLFDLGSDYLRRDGALYDVADYPDLAALLPSLPDGVAWSTITTGASTSPKGVASTPIGFLMAVDASNGTDTEIWKSTDGESYSFLATVVGMIATQIGYMNSVYVLAGFDGSNNGKVASSNDAVTWGSPVTVFTGASVQAIAFGAGVYVSVGTGGNIASSPDLATWTPRTSGTTNPLWGVRFLNSNFIVLGNGGVLLTSANGTSYSSQTSGTTENLFDAAYGSSTYVVVGTTGKIISSTNLTSWTPRTSGTTATLKAITVSTSGFIAVGDTGTARISSVGTSWASSTTGVSANLFDIIFDPSAQQKYFTIGGISYLKGVRTLPTQFAVPNDGANQWVRAIP